VFDVSVNGAAALTGFDIVAQAGAGRKAVVKECAAAVDSLSRVFVGFARAGADNPCISGIETLENTGAVGTGCRGKIAPADGIHRF